ncbi:type IX secretion system membrane protein PorP/SprF [Pedobacter sp. ISL-68]|uniref:PorP/SprF family type IX secretion system membrane protein n=1 Tax=unclassified Pedobacter TaxID=2628915 RepID=UPI001BEC5C94|nr:MULTISPECIES: type IX secretion system membrane protein PorP/SprF [unclassified Pedobacter]MBT2564401.1 type IX secretion system membrane protein PorP/SprF [Pedobacter sp. ISL-64]MBT2589923.1 type IX secretion system membrane protein PorP/SprF [Pedobacter sp. ISL-68]
MKKWLLLLILCANVKLYAQQRPQYSQYLLNSYLLNPALSGIENYTDVKLGYRQQWAGLQDAPKTAFVSAHWALGDEYLWANALSFETDGNDPRSRSYTQNYTASPAHHGVGFVAVSDKAGQLSTTTFDINYAYHLQLNNRLNLSLGVAGGISRVAIDINALLLENPQDPALNNAANARLLPDLSVGAWLYGANFFSGLSIQQVLPQKLSFSGDEQYNTGKQVAHVFLNSGYKFYLAEDLNITPSVLFKYIPHVPLSVDVNVKMGFKDRIWIGAGYRKQDALNMMAGFNINHLFNLTYSYDVTTSTLNQVSRGSHEVVLGLLLNNVYKVVCPQRQW